MEQNHYKIIKFLAKESVLKVHNYKKNQIEVYKISSTKKGNVSKSSFQKTLSSKTDLEKYQKSPNKVLVNNSKYVINNKKKFSFKTFFSLYNKYKKYSFLSKNDFFFKYLAVKFFKDYGEANLSHNLFYSNYNNLISQQLFKSLKPNPNIISVYITLRQNNIFVTLMKNDTEVLKVFSSGLFDVSRSDRKRSPSFFLVIKKTLHFLRPYIQSGNQKYLFKLTFKGFKRFRRPLINRFLFNKGFQSKCIGIFNLDFEPFNGCRKRKAKRIKIKNKRKKKT